MNKVGDSLPISANDKVRERVDEYLLFSAFRDIYLWGTTQTFLNLTDL